MNRDEPKRPSVDSPRRESPEPGSRSGEGAATALQAMLRKRKQAELPDLPELPGIDTPACPQA